MKYNNYLVSAHKDGKVHHLYYSEDLSDLQTIKAMHKDCEVEVIPLSTTIRKKEKPQTDNYVISRNGKPFANRVKCIETGRIFKSVSDCSSQMTIPPKRIYKAIRRNIAAYGYHFIFIPPNNDK